MLGAVHVGGVEGEQRVGHPGGLRGVGEGAVDDKDGEEGQQRVEADLVESIEGVDGVDEACRADTTSWHPCSRHAWSSTSYWECYERIRVEGINSKSRRPGNVDAPGMKARSSPGSPSWSVSKKSTCCCSTLRLLAVFPPSGFSVDTALLALGSSGCLICRRTQYPHLAAHEEPAGTKLLQVFYEPIRFPSKAKMQMYSMHEP